MTFWQRFTVGGSVQVFGPRSQSNGAELADIINNYTKSENLHATALVMQVFREGFYTTKSLRND